MYQLITDYMSSPLINGADLYANGELVTDLVIPDTVTEIRYWLFSGCQSIRSVVFPEGLTTIWEHAFENCPNLTEISFPSTLEFIGGDAFTGCNNIQTIHYAGTVKQRQAIRTMDGNDAVQNTIWTFTTKNILLALLPFSLYLAFQVVCVVVIFILEPRFRNPYRF